MIQDLRRLSEDPAEPELAQALREARGDGLSSDAVTRLQAALAAGGITVAGASAGGLGSGTAKLVGTAVRLRVGLGLVGFGLLGIAGGASMQRPGGPAAVVSAPEQAAVPVQATTAPQAQPDQDTTGEPEPPSANAPTASALPLEATTRTGRARAPTLPSPREGALLLEARRALAADPARALALVRVHQREFPSSQLRPERGRIADEARQRLKK